MIPELGHFALILALCMSLVQGVVPIVGAQRGTAGWIAVARPAALVQFALLALAYAALTHGFLTHDFTVAYVANNSNTELPLLYRISGVWGAHEGSLLLWALILSGWTALVAVYSRSVPEDMVARVIGVLGLVSVGFLIFMIFTSNPFERLVPSPPEGRDLNPLLQDPGLAIHPPMLYMGYVGFAVPFAFAVAAMLGGRLDAAWARWSRPWTNFAWMFLTIGIALGSWWAYYELGWGGWWFWDPVENASFLPWLVGTALMHSLAVTEKRGAFKAWTVLLAIFAFSLSLLGTFLVRSGVLTSVHAFASDPTRGVFILAFLVVVVGSSLLLYSMRAAQIRSFVRFDLVSRETAMLLGNVFLVVSAASILLGTLYPLIIDAFTQGQNKISVGPPYFNSVFVPLMVPLVVVMGLGMMLRWKQDSTTALWQKVRWPVVVSIVAGFGLTFLFMPAFHWGAVLTLALAVWVAATVYESVRDRLGNSGRRLASLPRGYWGMVLGHLGVAVFIVGVGLTSIYSTEKDVSLRAGESYELGGYTFAFKGVENRDGPNFRANRGTVEITRDGEPVTVLHPEKRVYRVQTMPMTEAGIDAGLFRDLFVALGDPLGDDAWAVRLYHKPFIRWIWLGSLIMGIGGILAASDRRYRVLARRERELAAGSGAAA